MRLDEVSAELRPRNPWEAMDLGVVLLRDNFKAVYGPWSLTVLPFAVLLGWVLRDNLLLAALVFWWCKPAYDRLVLFVLSRALFGAAPSVRETLRALPGQLASGLFWALTLYRFDYTRSFNLPVWQLEGLRGRARWQRAKVLQDDARSHAAGLTIAGVHLEVGMNYALLTLVALMLPEHMQGDFLAGLLSDESAFAAELASYVTYVIAASMIEPLYVACGFTLYLNRRTRLEGWDLEVAFRRMAQRLTQRAARSSTGTGSIATVAVLSVALGIAALPLPLSAQQPDLTDPEQADDAIEQVLSDPQFGQEREVKYWALKSDETPDEDDAESSGPFLAVFLARIGELLIWLAVLLGLVILIANHGRWRRLFGTAQSAPDPRQRPSVLFGMQITKDSLPQDIAGSAWRLWQQGDHRGAVSLLYRGALATLVDRDGVKLGPAATEGDCLRQVRRHANPAMGQYFERLTRGWLQLAYAHLPPSTDRVRELCEQWPAHFAPSAADGESA